MGAAAAGAGSITAVDLSADKADQAITLGATQGLAWQGTPEATAESVRELSGGGVDYAFEATGRPDAMLAAFLSTRQRGAAVLIGIPAEDAVLPLPARSIPRMERRVIGALYGSARPDRDFGVILNAYRRGRLPLDRLISHRMPLEGIGEAFELLRAGSALRTVIEFNGEAGHGEG